MMTSSQNPVVSLVHLQKSEHFRQENIYTRASSHKSRNPGSLLLRFRECELIYTGGGLP